MLRNKATSGLSGWTDGPTRSMAILVCSEWEALSKQNAMMSRALVLIGQHLYHELLHVDGLDADAFEIAYQVTR